MPVTEAQVDKLLAVLDAGRQSWIDGKLGIGSGMDVDQDDDMTLFGPFGGLVRGRAELSGRQDRAAQMFEGGEGRCEVIKTIVTGDVVVVVLVERNITRIHGQDAPQPWILRTTQAFQRVDDRWVRLHRHADPLIDFRPPARSFALARGE